MQNKQTYKCPVVDDLAAKHAKASQAQRASIACDLAAYLSIATDDDALYALTLNDPELQAVARAEARRRWPNPTIRANRRACFGIGISQ